MPDDHPPTSQDWTWDIDATETFLLLNQSWDISRAKRFLSASPHEVFKIDPEDAARWIGLIAIDWDGIKAEPTAFNLDVPVILAQTAPGTSIIIDGWHRVARAHLEHAEYVLGCVLTLDETRACRK
jgi:hypothetical protein